jgi:hypothetical protein
LGEPPGRAGTGQSTPPLIFSDVGVLGGHYGWYHKTVDVEDHGSGELQDPEDGEAFIKKESA